MEKRKFVESELLELSRAKGFKGKDNLVKVCESYYYLWMCELQQWLRDTYETHIRISYDWYLFDASIMKWGQEKEIRLISTFGATEFSTPYCFYTYEQALEGALLKGLELIVTNEENL